MLRGGCYQRQCLTWYPRCAGLLMISTVHTLASCMQSVVRSTWPCSSWCRHGDMGNPKWADISTWADVPLAWPELSPHT